jgi:hypothetical protein
MLESTDMTIGLGTPNAAVYVSGLAAIRVITAPFHPPAPAKGLTLCAKTQC